MREKLLVYILLLRNSMILKLQEKISFSKNILITQGCDFCILIHSTCKISGTSPARQALKAMIPS